MNVTPYPLTHFETRQDDIHFIIIHGTGLPDLNASLEKMSKSVPPNRVSCHYLIDTDGVILQLVPDEKTAWHAGVSDWMDYAKNKGLNGLNHSSIGIELQLAGLSYDSIKNEVLTFAHPTQKQLLSCVELCRFLMKKYNISADCVLRHSDVAPLRKFDPGQNFPWIEFQEQLHNI